tara:strand:+ start:148 stop:369 length:222 start_codon:yes stop_codon:yes gene_type:complete
MKRKKIHNIRRTSIQRSPIRHLTEEGHLLKEEGGVGESEEVNTNTVKRENRNKKRNGISGAAEAAGSWLGKLF